MKYSLMIPVLVIFSLTSCQSTEWAVVEPVSNLQQRLALWEGYSTTSLADQIGPPTEIVETVEGDTVHVYYKQMSAPDGKSWHCKVGFTVEDEKILTTQLISRNENAWGIYMPCVHIIQSPQ